MERKANNGLSGAEIIPLAGCRQRVLIMQSKDPCGYTREFAVKELACFPSEETVNALIVRVNDWVPVIRLCAKRTLLDMLSEASASYYARNLSQFNHLRKCGRSEHADFVRDIEGRLCLNRGALVDAISSASAESAKLSAGLLAKDGIILPNTLVNICLDSCHECVRRFALILMGKLTQVDLNLLRRLALSDQSAKVRYEAFRKLARFDVASANLTARELLVDVHPGVRSVAIYHLKKNNIDCVSAYYSMLSEDSPRRQKIAVWGLMELFSKASLSEILRKLKSAYPSVRLQALRACYVLCEEQGLERVLKSMLFDNSPKIVKESARMMEKCCITIPSNQFEHIIYSQEHVKVYGALFRITHKMNKWQQLILLSKLSVGAEKSLHSNIEKALACWFEKIGGFYVDPTERQIAEIMALDNKSKRIWNTAIRTVIAQRIALCG